METRRLESPDLAIVVPATWTEKRDADGIELVSPDGSDQLILSVLTFKKAQGAAARREAVEQLMQTRRQAFEKTSAGGGQLLPTEMREEGDSCVATLVGASAVAAVMTFVRIVATPARVVTASFYRYGSLSDPKGFTKVAEDICGGLEVAARGPAKTGWRRWLPL